MRVAVVHEWLVTYAGSERVLEQMLQCVPTADLFSVVDFRAEADRDFTLGKKAHTTFIQKLPLARKFYRVYLPLMPLAIEQLDLSGYDLIISSSHAVAKGVLTGPDQVHICMCYSPIRYAWDLQHQYLRESNITRGPKSWLIRWFLHKLRIWDSRTANGVDRFLAISDFIARRIKKTYGRESHVIYPPVDIGFYELDTGKRDDFFVTVSRMVPYKRIDLIIEAFSRMPEKRLVVIGDGPELEKLKRLARKNVEIMGQQSGEVLRRKMQRARAFVFAAEEDFGIVPIEAQACGTPVIAYGKGGVRETIRTRGREKTGVFFQHQTAESLCEAIREFESIEPTISPETCRRNAERFSPERFREEFMREVESVLGATHRTGEGNVAGQSLEMGAYDDTGT